MTDTSWQPLYGIRFTRNPNGGQDVEVLDDQKNVVGSYTYNYGMKPPFFAFELVGQWYAFYARDYTASRIMKLPSCEDVWGEDPDTYGFCPVAYPPHSGSRLTAIVLVS